jgi:Rps23 Pro-64 3,4-dihydroxylase Tpa1-like proline 4-hydroxylase
LSQTPLVKKYLDNCYYFGVSSTWFANEFGSANADNPEKGKQAALDFFINKCNEYAEKIYEKFPELDDENWYEYNNPIEYKFANDKLHTMSRSIQKYFNLLSTNEIIKVFSNISSIENLEYDPYLHGAGIHIYPKNGKLDIHVDYEKHPYMEKERRLNIILYMSKDWKEEWNGETELWNKDMTKCVVKSPVKFNTAIIFKTNDNSWHGVPETIKCPENVYRKSLAYYYVSPLESKPETEKIGNDGSGYRTKATFKKRPEDEYDELKEKIYKIRPFRLIDKSDLIL